MYGYQIDRANPDVFPELNPTWTRATKGFDPEAPSLEFRLLDDDGIVYFYGRINLGALDNEECDEDIAFAPLNWAMSGYGCTEMQIKRDGAWETL